MKNKFNIYIALALLIIGGSACDDQFLEDKKNFAKPDDSFYENETRVDWYISRRYYDLYNGYNSPVKALIGAYSDEKAKLTEEIGGMQNLINPTKTFVDANDGSGYYGTRLENKMKNEPYSRIRDYNSLIEEIDIKGANLDED